MATEKTEQKPNEEEELSYEELFNAEYGEGVPEEDDNEEEREEEGANDTAEEDEGGSDDSPEPDEEDSSDDGEAQATDSPKAESKPTQEEVDDEFAWIDALDEDVKKKAAALAHDSRSNRGRVSALSRRVNELQAKMDAAAAADQRLREAQSAGKNTGQQEDDFNKVMSELAEESPALAERLKRSFDAYDKRQQSAVEERLKPIAEKATQDEINRERQKLEEGAAELFQTASTNIHYLDVVRDDHFQEWLASQPKYVQRVASSSMSAEENLDVLSRYMDYVVANAPEQKPKEKPEETTPEASEKADKVKEKRKQKLDSSVTPPSERVGGEPEELVGDYEAMFNRRWGKKN